MSEFSLVILPVLLSFCIFVSTTSGGKDCNCRCSLPPFGEEQNVCAWLDENSPKVHSNSDQIGKLTTYYRELLNSKFYFEKQMKEKVLPFIETHSQQSDAQKTTNTNTNELVVDLAAEIEALKKLLKTERDELEAKIHEIESNCMHTTGNLLAKVDAIENRAAETESVVLQKINKTEEQTLEMREEILVRVAKTGDQNLKIQGDILEKINEAEKQISNLSSNIFSKIQEVEIETLNLKDEFLVQTKEQKSQITSAKQELVEKIEGLEKETSTVQDGILQKTSQLENQITNSKEELLVKMNATVSSRDSEMKEDLLVKMDVIVEKQKRDLKTQIEEVENNLRDEFQVQANEQKSQIAGTKQELVEKITDLEKETSKMKDSILQKTTQLENQITNSKEELLMKMNETISSRDSEMKEDLIRKMNESGEKQKRDLKTQIEEVENTLRDEFQVQANDQKSQIASTKQEFVKKMEDLERKASKVKNDIEQKTTQLENKMTNSKKELLMKMNETVISRESEMKEDLLRKVNESGEKQKRDLQTQIEEVDNSLRYEISTQRRRWIQIQAKADKMEEVLEKLNPEEINSNIWSIGQNVSKIKSDVIELWDNVTFMWSRMQPVPVLKTLEEQKTCANALPPSDTVPSYGMRVVTHPYSYNNTIQEVLRYVISDNETQSFACYGVVISNHWLVVPPRCIKNPVMYIYSRFSNPWNPVAGPRSVRLITFEGKTFLYSGNQLCSTCSQWDIGLLQIKELVEPRLPANITAVCLPTHKMRDKVTGSALLYVWPGFRGGPSSHINKLHKVNIISDDECGKSYSTLYSSTICTQYNIQAYSDCQDSEEGLLFKDIDNRTVLIGIVDNCGSDGQPILYTEVAYYSDWIYTFTNSLE